MANGYATLGGLGSGLGNLDGFGFDYLESNPDAAYADWLAELGLGGSGRKDSFARGQFGRYYDQYKASLARDPMGRTDDPNLYWTKFMRNFNPGQEFDLMGPEARGDRQTGVPRMRWLTPMV